ncbi:hypothetical protein PISMIDRAFT_690045, partial [Pisolithus microcarpus 441]
CFWTYYHEIACCEASSRLQKDRLAQKCDTYVDHYFLPQPAVTDGSLRPAAHHCVFYC